jgi:hypothetical protein
MKADKTVRNSSNTDLNRINRSQSAVGLELLNPMVTDDEGTHIRISKKHYKELTDLGKKNETYDQIIGRLIRFYKQHKQH